jgi:hypothetical protein
MRLNELFEVANNHVTFVFGRMNPPTIGHKQLLDTAKSVGGDYRIFLSQTQDPKKNPLDYQTKINFVKEMFPEHADNVVDDGGLNTVVKVADWLYNNGYKNATFVAGSDRLEAMKQLLTTYNGVEGKAHGFYKFEVLDFKSSGDREDGAEGVAGVSASNARAAAANGDFEAFKESTGAGELAQSLYDAVRKGMLIEEGWKDAAIGAAMLGIGGGAMYAQPQPKVEIDGVKWTLTSRTPGILAHSKIVTAADGKKYQVWRGPKNRHLAHPIDNKPAAESRGHKVIATKLANMDRMKNVQVPTPAERRAEQEKKEKEQKK